MINANRRRGAILLALAAAVLAVLVAPLVGSVPVSWTKAWRGEAPDADILFTARVPRVLLALLVGGALSVTGLLFQAVLRDSLADPYTLGISSGASAGAVTAIAFGLRPELCALGGAGATLFAVLALAWQQRRVSPFALLFGGVSLNFLCVAVIVLVHSLASVGQSFVITRWLMGGLDVTELPVLLPVALTVAVLMVLIYAGARHWNLLALGDRWAEARGIAATRWIIAAYGLGSVLTAAVTTLAGPVGFVGLIVPHALRLRLGADHRVLIPAAFLWGGAFLVACDTLARTVLAPVDLPVGVVTALVGGPIFLTILRTRLRLPQ
jgi:iron complex transport system permease protein